MRILGFQKTTLLDYPGKLASLIFTGGCNFRCPYCQNGELVTGGDEAEPFCEADILNHLKRRAGIIEGLVISGGEPTLQPGLVEFAEQVKALGIAVKLDTNGTNPDVVEMLINRGLIDYVAMDIKQCPEKYHLAAGLQEPGRVAAEGMTGLQNAGGPAAGEAAEIQVGRIPLGGIQGSEAAGTARANGSEKLLQNVRRTADLLLSGSVDYEFRTTFVDELFEDSDFSAIAKWIHGAKRYYIQPYRESEGVIAPEKCTTPADERLEQVLKLLKREMPETELALRGYELAEGK